MVRKLAIATMALLPLTAGPVWAGKFTKGIEIGDAGTAWVDLEGADGERHSLKDLDRAKVVVIAFTGSHCPVAQAYEERLVEFARDYADRDVMLVAINCEASGAADREAMRKRAEEKGLPYPYPFPYLYDPEQTVARSYRAMVTPHLYVLDGERNIAYMGAFDNSMDPSKVKYHYVRDAVDALLDGRMPEVTETKQFGCGIQYEK